MINLSNVLNLPIRQDYSVKNQKEKNNLTENSNNNAQIKLASPSAEHLKANYLSFGVAKKSGASKAPAVDSEQVEFEKLLKSVTGSFDKQARKIFQESIDIAVEKKTESVNQHHLYQALLTNSNDYIEKINSGEKNPGGEEMPILLQLVQAKIDPEIISKEEKRQKFQLIVQEEMKRNSKILDAMPKADESGPALDYSLIQDINDEHKYQQQENPDVKGLTINEGILIDSLIESGDEEIKAGTAKQLLDKTEDTFIIDHEPVDKKPNMKFYEEKAKTALMTLAIGKNAVITHETDSSPDYLYNSILSSLNKENSQFGKLNKENTDIIMLDNPHEKFISELKAKREKSPKNTIIIVKNFNKYMMTQMEQNAEGVPSVSPSVFVPFLKNKDSDKVKFVCGINQNTYYSNISSPLFAKAFENFNEISLPIPNQEQTKKIFKEEPKLLKDLKSNFSPNAVNKCIEIAEPLKGNYPYKALGLMKLIDDSYPDKKEMHLTDVNRFAKEASDLLKVDDKNNDEQRVIFDTGKKLKDIVGSDMTKADAEEIVYQIKKGTIGTKGIIVHADTEAGGGRKHVIEAIAGEAKVPFIPINSSDFSLKDSEMIQKGETPEVKIKKLFKTAITQAEAAQYKTAIIFVEGFDNLATHPLMGYHPYEKKAFNQMMLEMDNVRANKKVNILVIGSSSHPSVHDPAIRKPGKFMESIMVYSTTFDPKQRVDILNYYIKKDHVKIAGKTTEEKQSVIKSIADSTDYSSVVDLIQLLGKAQSVARNNKHKEGIDEKDFKEALLQLSFGRPNSLQNTVPSKRVTTGHECGHMLNGFIMNEWAEKNQKHWNTTMCPDYMTLDPRGYFAGMVSSNRSKEDEFTPETLFADLVLSYGGYSVENKLFGIGGSSGISADIDGATIMTHDAVTKYGQGSATGRKSFNTAEALKEWYAKPIKKDMDACMENAEVVSNIIIKTYQGFVEEFTDRYSDKVGSGKTIITKKEFKDQLEDWKLRQNPDKQKEIENLDNTITKVINATRKGVIVDKDSYLNPEKQINKNDASDPYSIF